MKSQEVEELGEVPPAQMVAQWEILGISADQEEEEGAMFFGIVDKRNTMQSVWACLGGPHMYAIYAALIEIVEDVEFHHVKYWWIPYFLI